MIKITHGKRYVTKQKSDIPKNDDELDLLGDQEVESFSGSHADLKSAADHLFTSPPRPQPLAFEALSLQQKIESKLDQSLGSHLDIQLEQKMGVFQANMLEAMKSLREDFQKSIQKTSSQVEVDQISALASKPGPSNTVYLDPSPRDLDLFLILSSRWKWSMVLPYLHVSGLILLDALMTPRISA